jgi:5-methylthioadenosine/S-adenosylhomocysteine deaminase
MGLTVTDCALDGRRVSIRCSDGLIESIGQDVEAQAGDELIDAGGMLVAPPFVNGHTHAAMTLFRGFGDDLPLMEWLENHIWPAEARLEPDDVYWGTRLAAIEMIRSGTSRFFDMYWHSDAVARAVNDAGLRAVVSAVVIDRLDAKAGEGMRGELIETVERLAEAGPLIKPAFGPHAIYTVSPETLRWLADEAAERDLILQIHLSETEQEVSDCLDAHGKRPAAYLDELGFLGPRTILAHGVWLDREELHLVADRGSTIVSNPAANMKLAVGAAFPYIEASGAGAHLALGTDGVSSNSNLDMLEEVKLFSLLAKHTAGDPAVAPANEALQIARGRRSPALAGTPLEPGQPADFLLLDPMTPELIVGAPEADLVYAGSGSVVDTTVVAGRPLMRGRQVDGTEEALSQVRERAARLTAT